jgi:hypothetical protein
MFLWEPRFYGLTLTLEDKLRIHQEIFHLCYNANGAFTHDEIYSMPIFLRYFNLRMLLEQRKKEEAAQKNHDSAPTNSPQKIVGRSSAKKAS